MCVCAFSARKHAPVQATAFRRNQRQPLHTQYVLWMWMWWWWWGGDHELTLCLSVVVGGAAFGAFCRRFEQPPVSQAKPFARRRSEPRSVGG